MSSLLQIFLCHGKEDKQTIRELYARLQNDGFKPWLDEEDILPGQDWEFEIKKAIEASDVMIACFSSESISRDGYVQKEIRLGLEVAQLKREESIFLIAARLSNCKVPSKLVERQWVDLFEARGYEKLVKSLMVRADQLGRAVSKTSSAILPQSPLFQQRTPFVTPEQPTDNKCLIVSGKDLSALLAHCQASAPVMSCGLLGGNISDESVQVKHVANIKNAIADQSQRQWAGFDAERIYGSLDEKELQRNAFLMDRAEMAHAFKKMSADALEHVGCYYSQYGFPPRPSRTTLEMAKNNRASMIYLIIEQDEDGTPKDFRAWQIDTKGQVVMPVDIRLGQ